MGLLDDAIREHLDLKRRRGADPAEIERAEQEALGPVRRGPDEADGAAFDHEPGAAQELAYDHEEEGDWDESFEAAPAEEGLEYEVPTARKPEEPWAHGDSFAEEQPSSAGASSAAHPAHGSPARPAESAGDETAEYELEDHPEQESEDVLEETPEFLQDTPDHDRLWFEQRPPRDFDFGN